MATVRDFQVNNGLEVNLNANVANAVSASDFIQSNPERAYAPTVVFDFSKSQQLDPRITFVRASNATYTAANGLIASVGNDVPRFQFENGMNQGLFIETQRQNLVKYSNDFFTGLNTNVVSGSYVFYDGSIGLRQGGLGMVLNQDYAVSIYIKINAQSNQNIGVNIGDNTANSYNANTAPIGQWVRVSGICRLGPSGDIFDIRVNTPKIGIASVQVWFGNPANTGFVTQNYGIAPNGLRESTRVNWTSTDNTLFDMELWGGQVEAGTYVTSYIPTTSFAATRMYDFAYITDPITTIKMNPKQGAFLFVGKTYKAHNANNVSYDIGTTGLMLQDSNFGTQNNYAVMVVRDDTTGQLYSNHITQVGSTYTQTSVGGGSNFFFTNTEIRCVANYTYTSAVKQYNIAGSSNGVSNTSASQSFVTTATSASPALTVSVPFPSSYLVFGQNYGFGNRMWGGPIKKVAYYNRTLSNNEIITLTTI